MLGSGTSGIIKLSEIFAAACQPLTDSYAYSLPYYLSTGRKGATVYHLDDNYVATCIHPHKENTLLVFPQIGNDYTLTAKLLLKLRNQNAGVQLARYNTNQQERLCSAIQKLEKSDHIIIAKMDEDLLDWKFPVRILDTGITSHLAIEKKFRKLMKGLHEEGDSPKIVPLNAPGTISAIKASIHFWVASLIYAGDDLAVNYIDFYKSLIEQIEKNPGMYDGFVVIHRDEPAGFTIWDKPIAHTANGLASLSRRAAKGMSEYQIFKTCEILKDNGIKFFNMGGSEEESLDNYKMKFKPTHSLKIASYEVKFCEPNSPIGQIALI